jgi:hypothetical protein
MLVSQVSLTPGWTTAPGGEGTHVQHGGAVHAAHIPMTVLCNGNCQKELITHSQGFNWGTALWGGVSLASINWSCGVQPGAHFVCADHT